jgi:hypothetical protein
LCNVQSWLKCEWAANSTVFNKLLSISNLGVYWQEVRETPHSCDTSHQAYSIAAKIHKSLAASDLRSGVDNVTDNARGRKYPSDLFSLYLPFSLFFLPGRARTKAWRHPRVQTSFLRAPSGFYHPCRQRQWQRSIGVHPPESARGSGSRFRAKRYDFCSAQQQGIYHFC